MSERVCNVLFLCTGNSSRSIIAECLLNALGKGRFRGYSAGSQPTGRLNPVVTEYLASVGISTEGAHSKSWHAFAKPGAPQMDMIITVCDEAAEESCPVWPGMPATAHWSAPDPARESDPDRARAMVRHVFQLMHRRISLLIAFPLEKLDRLSLQNRVRAIADQDANAAA